jgi:NAD+-dependent protein deacetylase sirtuin 5
MLVIGTSTEIHRGTAYIETARQKSARIAVVNVEKEDPVLLGLGKQNWYFEGDAAVIVPNILRPTIGSVGEMQENQQNTDLY